MASNINITENSGPISVRSNFATAKTEIEALQLNKQDTLGFTPENTSMKGVADGYASLGSDGKVPASQLPAYVDDILEYTNISAFPATGSSGVIYVSTDANQTYRWSGSTYVPMGGVNAVESVAGKTGAVTLTKTDVGLGNVDNTSDLNKPISTATQTALDGKQDALGFTPENTALKGVADGYASLNSTGKVPVDQLPSFVDDVVEFAGVATFPATGITGVIYVALDTNQTYRWSGSTYIAISPGAVITVAGKSGVVTLTKSDVGLNNVDNTSDLNKPISTATQTALDNKQPLDADLTSIAGLTGTSGILKKTAANTWELDTTTYVTSATAVTSVSGRTGAVTLTKTDVGLGNVDNTSDLNKPISTATQTALDNKQPLDADLTSIAGLTGTSGILKKTAANTWTLDTATYLSSATSINGLVKSSGTTLSAATAGTDYVTPTGTETLTNKTVDTLTLNKGYTEQVFAVSGTGPALSPLNGSIQTWTLSGASTPSAGTWASGQSIVLMIAPTTNTVSWGSVGVTWPNGVAPTLKSGATTTLVLWKVGTTIFGAVAA